MHIYCSDMAGHWALRRLACQQQRMHSTTRNRKRARERGRARAKPDNPISSDCWPSAQGVARVDKNESRLLEGELHSSRLWADRSLCCSHIVWYLAEASLADYRGPAGIVHLLLSLRFFPPCRCRHRLFLSKMVQVSSRIFTSTSSYRCEIVVLSRVGDPSGVRESIRTKRRQDHRRVRRGRSFLSA